MAWLYEGAGMYKLALILLSVGLAPFPTWSADYSSGPITGRIVDAPSKAPVPGATIVVQWFVKGGIEGHITGLLHVEEAGSDDAGVFQTRAWGPVRAPAWSTIRDADPEILIFKSGYLPRLMSNDTPVAEGRLGPPLPAGYGPHSSVRVSAWNGRDLEINRFHGSVKDYNARLRPTVSSATLFLFGLSGLPKCWWKQTPRLVRALDDEMKLEHELGVKLTDDLRLSARLSERECAPFDDFLKAYDAAQ